MVPSIWRHHEPWSHSRLAVGALAAWANPNQMKDLYYMGYNMGYNDLGIKYHMLWGYNIGYLHDTMMLWGYQMMKDIKDGDIILYYHLIPIR